MPQAANVARVTMAFRNTLTGNDAVNVFHVDTAALVPITLGDLVAIAVDFDEWYRGVNPVFSPAYQDFQADEYRLELIRVQDLNAGGLTFDFPTVWTGAATAEPLPPQVAAVISWRTGQGGRSFRGRSYLAGLTEGANDTTGHIAAADVASLVIIGTELITRCNAAGNPLVVNSTTLGVKTAIETAVVDNIWDIQRRRRG